MRYVLGIGAAGLLLVLGFVALVLLGQVGPRRAGERVLGVDVAHYQGDIDWVALSGDETGFAFIKATEGGDWVDPKFHQNWQGARRAGLLRGAYHFFTLCRDAEEQARHFLATVGDMRGALLPALDAEHMGPCRGGPTMTDVADSVGRFLDTVDAATGMRPVIYTTSEFYEAHLRGHGLSGERYWLRSIYREPDFGPPGWVFWQYSGRGRRRGIRGPVDLNIFDGNAAGLEALRVQ